MFSKALFYLIFVIKRGVVSISVSLNKFDLKQCGKEDSINNTNDNLELSNISQSSQIQNDPFYNTDECNRETTQVSFNQSFMSILIFLYILVYSCILHDDFIDLSA